MAAQVLTETFHTFFQSPLSQGSLSCIIRDKSTTNLRSWPSYFRGSFCCHLHFHQHSAASSLLKQLREFSCFVFGQDHTTGSTFISMQEYTEKRNLKYRIVSHQEHRQCENKLKEKPGREKYFLLVSLKL